MMANQHCREHCAACDRHFHGVGAFDTHRRDFDCLDPETATTEKGNRLLQALTDEGDCDLMPGCWVDGKRVRLVYPVVIWQKPITDKQREWQLSQTLSRSRRLDGQSGTILQIEGSGGVAGQAVLL